MMMIMNEEHPVGVVHILPKLLREEGIYICVTPHTQSKENALRGGSKKKLIERYVVCGGPRTNILTNSSPSAKVLHIAIDL